MKEYNANHKFEGYISGTDEVDYEKVVEVMNENSDTMTLMTLAEYMCIIETVVFDIY